MRKVLSIMLLLSFVQVISAQEPILLDKDFQMNGAMTLFWETEDPKDISNADEGTKWHLEQKKINGVRHITFWIDLLDPSLKQLSKTTWKDAVVTMITTEEKMKMYVVRDYQFRHLLIAEYEKGKYVVQLCSIIEER